MNNCLFKKERTQQTQKQFLDLILSMKSMLCSKGVTSLTCKDQEFQLYILQQTVYL